MSIVACPGCGVRLIVGSSDRGCPTVCSECGAEIHEAAESDLPERPELPADDAGTDGAEQPERPMSDDAAKQTGREDPQAVDPAASTDLAPPMADGPDTPGEPEDSVAADPASPTAEHAGTQETA